MPHSMDIPPEHFTVSLDRAIEYIEQMDLSEIINKITQDDPNVARRWSVEEANEAVYYYKNFLILNKKYISEYRVIPPSIEIDEIWHHHILDTRRYHKDCISIFGYYFHHYPYFGMRGINDENNLKDTFQITQYLHHEEFGEYIYQVFQ